MFDNLDTILVPDCDDSTKDSLLRNIIYCVKPGNLAVLGSRCALPWPELRNLNTAEYFLGSPSKSSVIELATESLRKASSTDRFKSQEEAIAIENIVDLLSCHPVATQRMMKVLASGSSTARIFYLSLHERTPL